MVDDVLCHHEALLAIWVMAGGFIALFAVCCVQTYWGIQDRRERMSNRTGALRALLDAGRISSKPPEKK